MSTCYNVNMVNNNNIRYLSESDMALVSDSRASRRQITADVAFILIIISI